jgi:hypothetical protein
MPEPARHRQVAGDARQERHALLDGQSRGGERQLAIGLSAIPAVSIYKLSPHFL